MNLSKRFSPETRRDLAAFAVIFAALVLRMSWFGLEYYCQLDDYIHYRAYPAGTDFIALCIERGLFASRPLAALSDFVVWAKMPLYLGAVIIDAMYAGACILFLRLFRKLFSTGYFFVVFMALLPLGFEGTYWLSASTRIIPPLFFSALALTAFDRFCETKKHIHLIPYVLWSLLSFCLYEQMLVLSLALSLMLMLVRLLLKERHALWGLLVFLPVAAYAGFTNAFSSATSALSQRMGIILPTSMSYFTEFLPQLSKQVRSSFLDGGVAILGKGFLRGAQLIFSEGIWAVLLLAVLLPLIFRADRLCVSEGRGKLFHLAPLFGFLAALAPVTPFLIIEDVWFSLRNTVPSFLGIALILDYLLRLVTKNRTAVCSVLFAFVCMIASISETYDYKVTAEVNEQVVRAVFAADEAYDLDGTVGILGLNNSYLEDQNFEFHDHVLSAHGSGWALQGALSYYNGGAMPDYAPTPLDTDEEYYWYSWSREERNVTRYDHLLYYDHEAGTMELLTLETIDGVHHLYFQDGTLCARIWGDEQGYGHVEFHH